MLVKAKRDIGEFVKSGTVYVTSRESPDFSKWGHRFRKCHQNISIFGDTTINPINSKWPVGYLLSDFEVIE